MAHNDEGAKIFVGGIGETGEEELRSYFAQYGSVKAVQVKYDPNTQRARGFGFIIFDDMSTVDQVSFFSSVGRIVTVVALFSRVLATVTLSCTSGVGVGYRDRV